MSSRVGPCSRSRPFSASRSARSRVTRGVTRRDGRERERERTTHHRRCSRREKRTAGHFPDWILILLHHLLLRLRHSSLPPSLSLSLSFLFNYFSTRVHALLSRLGEFCPAGHRRDKYCRATRRSGAELSAQHPGPDFRGACSLARCVLLTLFHYR